MLSVFTSIGGSLGMAIWAQQPEVFYTVVATDTVSMIKLKNKSSFVPNWSYFTNGADFNKQPSLQKFFLDPVCTVTGAILNQESLQRRARVAARVARIFAAHPVTDIQTQTFDMFRQCSISRTGTLKTQHRDALAKSFANRNSLFELIKSPNSATALFSHKMEDYC